MNATTDFTKNPVYDGEEARYLTFQQMSSLGDKELFEGEDAEDCLARAAFIADRLEVPMRENMVPLFVWRMALDLF